MASETTAAAAGKTGIVRRDPMAMLPFCGYNIGEYFSHWIEIGKLLGEKAPKIFNVNWFRQDQQGNFIWPGFGENFRVLEWILNRCSGTINAKETAIGYIPFEDSINIDGLPLNLESLSNILKVDKNLWKHEAENIEKFYAKFSDTLPAALKLQLSALTSAIKE
jgi:phosphoenolpyruvate carboxykinase (GTP)